MDSLQPSDRTRCDAHHPARFATATEKDVLQARLEDSRPGFWPAAAWLVARRFLPGVVRQHI
jgi:hypothetical protein